MGSCLRVEELEARNLMSISFSGSGSWSVLNAPAPDNLGTMMLLTDGTVMAQGGGVTNQWYHLSPNGSGSYVNGTWSSLAPMGTPRLYFASNVLPDGRVMVLGGEYTNAGQTLTNTGEIYDPTVNSWTPMSNFPMPNFGDDPSTLLPDGRVLLGYVFDGRTFAYDPATDTYAQTATKLLNDASDEETWLTLPDGSILSYDVFNEPHAQRYLPATDQWVDAGTVPVNLSGSAYGYELGGAAVLPDGRAFYLGANGNTAFYNQSSNTWTQGTSIPGGLGADDAPMAMMPDGHILVAADHPVFNGPTSVFDFDPTANGGAGSYTDVTPAFEDMSGPVYVDRMLVLPSGGVLFANGSNQLAIYTPGGTYGPSWQPTISGYTDNGDGTFTLSGARLSGVSQGASYGDDAEMSTNYPIVQLTDPSGNVFYARTTNWSNTGISSPGDSTPQSVVFTPPANLPAADYSLVVIANGIPSAPVDFPYGGNTSPKLTSLEIQAPGTVTAGVPFSVTVTALDQSGNVFATYTGTVQFSSNDPAAQLPGPYTFQTSDGGTATLSPFTLYTAGQRTITVTDVADNLSASASITVVAGSVASWAYIQQPLDTYVGNVISPAVRLGLYDQYGNLETSDYSDTVSIAIGNNPSNGTLSGTTTVTVSGGVATFSDLKISTPGARYTLLASSPGLPSLTSAAFTVKALYQPPGNVIEDFENFNSETWYATGTNTYYTTGSWAAHDGNNGLDISGPDWIYRTDAGATVKAGDTLSVWMNLSVNRGYFGFGASRNGTLALTVAPNTGQLLLMYCPNYYTFITLGAVSYGGYQFGAWYRMQVDWGLNGMVTGRLFAGNGTTLLTQVTAPVASTGITSGGIAFRGTGIDWWFDTVIDQPGLSGGGSMSGPTVPGSGQSISTGTSQLQTGTTASASTVAAPSSQVDWPSSWSAALADYVAASHKAQRIAIEVLAAQSVQPPAATAAPGTGR